MRKALAGLLVLLVAVSATACGTGSQAVSLNTLSACHEVLYLNEPVVPKAHAIAVTMWPPSLFRLMKQSGSPQLEKLASDLPRDELPNRGVMKGADWDSAVKYCQSIRQ
jgi:hypothetical protein